MTPEEMRRVLKENPQGAGRQALFKVLPKLLSLWEVTREVVPKADPLAEVRVALKDLEKWKPDAPKSSRE